MEEGAFLCCFVVFVSFFEQGKKTTRGVAKVQKRWWCKMAAVGTQTPLATLPPHGQQMHPGESEGGLVE